MEVPERLELVRRSKLLLKAEALPATDLRELLGNADALVFDLRGAPRDRSDLYGHVKKAAQFLQGKVVDLLVRVEHDNVGAGLAPIAPWLTGIVTGTTTVEETVELDARLGDVERAANLAAGSLEIDLMVEHPEALLSLREIASASARIVSLTLDERSLSQNMGLAPSLQVDQFFYPRGLILMVARLAGKQAHGLAFLPARAGQPPTVEERAKIARRLGLMGALCESPSEAMELNRGFTPDLEDIGWSRASFYALEQAVREGRGSASVEINGNQEMLDIAMFKHARSLLWRESVVCAKDAQKTLVLEG